MNSKMLVFYLNLIVLINGLELNQSLLINKYGYSNESTQIYLNNQIFTATLQTKRKSTSSPSSPIPNKFNNSQMLSLEIVVPDNHLLMTEGTDDAKIEPRFLRSTC